MPALRRQVAPEAPVLRPLALLVRRRPVGPRHQPARIHPFVEQVDDFALARAVHPAKQDDHRRPAGLAQPGLFIEQLGAQGRDLRLVFPARYLPAQLGGFKHCDHPNPPTRDPRTRFAASLAGNPRGCHSADRLTTACRTLSAGRAQRGGCFRPVTRICIDPRRPLSLHFAPPWMNPMTTTSSSQPSHSSTILRPLIAAIAVASICIAAGSSRMAQPSFAITNGGSITALGVPLTENFDTLASSRTPTSRGPTIRRSPAGFPPGLPTIRAPAHRTPAPSTASASPAPTRSPTARWARSHRAAPGRSSMRRS